MGVRVGVSVRAWRAAVAETRSCAHLIVPDVVLVEEELPNDGELVDDDQHEQEGEEERLRVDRDRLDDLLQQTALHDNVQQERHKEERVDEQAKRAIEDREHVVQQPLILEEKQQRRAQQDVPDELVVLQCGQVDLRGEVLEHG